MEKRSSSLGLKIRPSLKKALEKMAQGRGVSLNSVVEKYAEQGLNRDGVAYVAPVRNYKK